MTEPAYSRLIRPKMWFTHVTLLLLLVSTTTHSQELKAGTVVSVAGDSTNGYNGDLDTNGKPRPSVGAQLNLPWGVALGSDGFSLFVADAGNHRVRRIDTRYWDISTVAGNGSPDYRGDGGLAVNASISSPAGLATDRDGNLYIADRGNNRVRKVDPDGVITTVAGSTQPGYSGDLGVATQAALKGPVDVAVDGDGSLYISDTGNNRIRMVDGSGVITTIAGSGERRYDGDDRPALEVGLSPSGIALDGAGGLLIADTRNHRIRLVDLQAGTITTIAGVGRRGFAGDGDLALGAELSSPWGVALSPLGDVYFTDSGNNRVRRVRMTTGQIETIAGSGETAYGGDGGPATAAGFWSPYGLAADAENNVVIADYLNHRLRRINQQKGEMPVYVPRVESGIPRWVKGAFVVLTSALGYFIYDSVQPPPDLPGAPDFPQ